MNTLDIGLLKWIPTGLGFVLLILVLYLVSKREKLTFGNQVRDWLLNRGWSVRQESKPQFEFIIWAMDDSKRELAITKEKIHPDILAFTAPIPIDKSWQEQLAKLPLNVADQLVENLKILFSTHNIGYGGLRWPLEKVGVQDALPINNELSQHSVDVKAKQVINAVIAARSTIRQTISQLTFDKKDSENQ